MTRLDVPGNSHYREAVASVDLIPVGYAANGETWAARAQAEAALAVALELRTANLIAFYAAGPVPGDSAAAWSRIRDEIVQRLGIKE